MLKISRIFALIIFSLSVYGEFNYSLTSSGITGVINTPNARTLSEGTYALQLYRGDPDRRLIFAATPYDWFEASLFYSSIKGRSYGSGFSQDYKDKGFNAKIVLKEQDKYPAIAVGV